MPICEKCGTGLPVGYEYCYQCGYPVRGLPAEEQTVGVMPPFPLPGAPDDGAPADAGPPSPPSAVPDDATGPADATAPDAWTPGAGATPSPPAGTRAADPWGYGPPAASSPGWGQPGRSQPGWGQAGWGPPGAASPAGAAGYGPTPALGHTQVLATWGARFVASLIDYMLVSMAVATAAMLVLSSRWGGEQNVLSHLTSSTGSSTLLELDAAVIAGFFVYCVVCELAFQATLGKRVLGLRVGAYGGARPSVGSVLLRNLTKAMSCLFPLVGLPLALVMIGIDANRQRIGDRLARTYVLRDVVAIVAPGTPR